MKFEINEIERKLPLSLKNGIDRVNIHKSGLYPTVVTFVLTNENKVTLRAIDEVVGPRFEVYPISITDEEINGEPGKIIDLNFFSRVSQIDILQKSEWSSLSSDEEKSEMLRVSTNATTQFEGKPSEIPDDAINHVTLHAGIDILGDSGKSFMVATFMFQFAFYVSNCELSESVDPNILSLLNCTNKANSLEQISAALVCGECHKPFVAPICQ